MCVYILQIPTLNYTVYAISTLVEQSLVFFYYNFIYNITFIFHSPNQSRPRSGRLFPSPNQSRPRSGRLFPIAIYGEGVADRPGVRSKASARDQNL